MSEWVLSRVDVDAFLSVAYRWTERGDVSSMPARASAVLTVTDANADDVGARLWQANHDNVFFGGPKHLCWDPELPATLVAQGEQTDAPQYVFEALPGTPRPETALRLADYFAYQTAGDHWRYPDDWEDPDAPPFEMRFTQAVRWHAARLLGLRNDDDPFAFPYSLEETGIDRDPTYEASGWGLGPDERNLFTRLL